MKALRYLILLVSVTVLSACAQMGPSVIAQTNLAEDNHAAWVNRYEGFADEAQNRLNANRKMLADYEARPYYYGRRGLDLQSHVTANIRMYEKELRKNLDLAEFHRKMAAKQAGLKPDSMRKAHLEEEYISDKPVKFENPKL